MSDMMALHRRLILLLLIFFLKIHHVILTNVNCKENTCSATKVKRYILYDVNKGEGFNLRRDIFVRIAPIVKSLNAEGNPGEEWVLVLPPWGNLPHWSSTSNYFNWGTFFDIQEIQKYIPAIEFNGYLDEYGLDNTIDVSYQLQHFPLSSPISKKWSENVRVDVKCDAPFRFIRTEKEAGDFVGIFWGKKLYAKKVSCLGVKGDSSNIVKFLKNVSPNSVLLDRGEVILWDHYGGVEFWKARICLKFAPHLIQKAKKWTEEAFKPFNHSEILKTSNYLAVHLRRGDFVKYRKDQPTLKDVANQVKKVLTQLKISNVFVATDGDMNQIQKYINDPEIHFSHFNNLQSPSDRISEGELAIIDQIICSWSKYFIGTSESTFTYRIFEEREILGIPPEFNYHNLCTDNPSEECPKSTRWPIMT